MGIHHCNFICLSSISSLFLTTSKWMDSQKTFVFWPRSAISWVFLLTCSPFLAADECWGLRNCTAIIIGWNIYGTRKSRETPKTQKWFARDLYHASTPAGFGRTAAKTKVEDKQCQSILEASLCGLFLQLILLVLYFHATSEGSAGWV